MKPPVAKKRKRFFDFDSEDTVNYDRKSIGDSVTVLAGVAETYMYFALAQLDVDNVSLCLAVYYTPKALVMGQISKSSDIHSLSTPGRRN